MMTAGDTNEAAWRVRPFLLAGIGAVAAMIVHHLLDTVEPTQAWRTALGCGIGIATFAFGFSLERSRIGAVIGFAGALGLVAGLILYWNHVPQMGTWGDWRYASLLLAVVIPVPLFQVAHARGACRFPYDEVHAAAWTNVVLWCACWVFAGIAFALAWLLAGLFGLIGLQFLRDLLGHGWANAALFGVAFGGALGLLRERAGIVLLLQRVVTAVLGVLAPVLAAGLVLFLCALPFTGLGALWEATKQTTPILLACVIGALILANAVIGNGTEDEATNPLLRYGAMALAVAMLPLTVIAALATGLRIQQYGFTPDRLWALVFVILASLYAVAYLGSVVRGRQRWAEFAREANLKLAFVVAGVALLLATPLIGFNAISTRDQVARLERGAVSPEQFDWAALAFDFGEPGRAAVKRLSRSSDPAIAARTREALRADSRWKLMVMDGGVGERSLATRVRIVPRTVPLPDGLLRSFARSGDSGNRDGLAVLRYASGDDTAVLVATGCAECLPTVTISRRARDGSWTTDNWLVADATSGSRPSNERRAVNALLARDGFDVRPVQRRQVFIDGKPVGEPFE